MELNLKDKVAIVTGGSGGVGKAICFGLAAEGVKVAVNFLKNEEMGLDFTDDANAVVQRIKDAGSGDACAVAADLGVEDEILAMFGAVAENLGPVDILVNCAAFLPSGPITSYTKDVWEYTFGVNVTGPFIATRELVKRLLDEDRQGCVVNIASQAAFLGSTSGHLPYDASKGALVSMTRAVAREVAPHGIRVNAIAPGMVMTEMVAAIWEERKDRYLSKIPLNRIAEPEEIANVVVFLASDASSYMTGTTLDLTGGMMMR